MFNLESWHNYEKHQKMIEEMHKHKAIVFNKLKQIMHPLYVENFANVLHYSWQENVPEAEILAEMLNLYPIDFSAIAEDEQEFERLFITELELRLEDYAI